MAEKKHTEKYVESRTRLYRIYSLMKRRCYNQNSDRYRFYGARGITVCDEWKKSFACFRDWSIANGYDDTLTIDRIDSNKGYSPDNCRWVNMQVQGNNRRDNHFLTYNGETKTMADWSRSTGLSQSVIQRRYRMGWSVEEILTTKLRVVNRIKRRAKERTMSDCNICDKCPLFPEIHTVKEWAELPDKISVRGKWYVYSDYRTDNDVDIPRFKFGDGKTMISKLPFCTASITDYDCEYWDGKADV